MAAAVVTYRYPVSGATPPTQIQASQVNQVVADVVFADGATVVNVVHNMQLSATGTDGRPEISWDITASGTALNQPVIAIVDANTVSITQTLGSANTGATYRLWIKRPYSSTR